MIKIKRDVTEHLLLICLYLKARGVSCFGVFEDGLKLKFPADSDFRSVLRGICKGGLPTEGPWRSWDEFIRYLIQQLEGGSESVAHHPTLIDLIVDILQGPYSKNVLAGKTLQSLRRAILLPEEMIRFGESANKELHCVHCGKTFHNREMSTFRTSEDGIGFYCVRCIAPENVTCHHDRNCDEVIALDPKLLGKLVGKSCPEHLKSVDDKPSLLSNEAIPPMAANPFPEWVEVGQAPPHQNAFFDNIPQVYGGQPGPAPAVPQERLRQAPREALLYGNPFVEDPAQPVEELPQRRRFHRPARRPPNEEER